MLLEELRNIADKERNEKTRVGYVLNLIKEYLQNIVLEYIYGNKAINHQLVFTGGTCLRFCFNLPRLSEDLDFDCAAKLDHDLIAGGIMAYFQETLGYREIGSSIKGKDRTIYLKFPILKQLNLSFQKSFTLLLKVEIARVSLNDAVLETSMVEKNSRSYFLKRYSLSDMMAGKIHAFLTRLFFKGKGNDVDFKGRDMYDLAWYMGKGIVPNTKRLIRLLKGTSYEGMLWPALLEQITQKAGQIKRNHIYSDLANFIEQPVSLDNFLDNYLEIINQYCKSPGQS